MSDFTGEWVLKNESESFETRQDPSYPDSMQSRYHFIIERQRPFEGDWALLKQIGATAASVAYYTGGTLHGASPYTGTLWQCTQDIADHPELVAEWRTQHQTWECWTTWTSFTPP